MACELVIFDCDGVLVDSELIALDVLREAIAEAGLLLDPDDVRARFLGRHIDSVAEALRPHGLTFGPKRQAAMAGTLRQRFEAELTVMPGMPDLIDSLKVPACVASSSRTARLRHALETVGLADRFGPNVFSADEVARGKPFPDLFLHTAAKMGADPAGCIVIEDSAPGLAAAEAAGMEVIAFTGGSHMRGVADVDGRFPRAESAADLALHLPVRERSTVPAG